MYVELKDAKDKLALAIAQLDTLVGPVKAAEIISYLANEQAVMVVPCTLK